MDTSDKSILFDLRGLPKEDRPHGSVYTSIPYNYMLIGYGKITQVIVQHYFFSLPSFEKPDSVLQLNHENWMEYQLIKHLPPETIYKHFFGEEP